MRLGLAQTDPAPRELDQSLAVMDAALGRAAAAGAQLVAFPELFLCGYGDPARTARLALTAEEALALLAPRAVRHGTAICLGLAERADGGLRNSALLVGADGRPVLLYRKIHLWGDYERTVFRPGESLPTAMLGGLRVGLLVCYDLEMPAAAHDLARRGVDLLVVLSATGTGFEVVPGTLVPARAYENSFHVAFCNHARGRDGLFCGGSRLAAPDGSVLARLEGRDPAEGLVIGDVDAAAWAGWRAAHRYFADQRDDLLCPARGDDSHGALRQ